MGQKEKYDKMLFCLEYAENRHSYTIEKTHKEGHFAISIKNKNSYIYIYIYIYIYHLSQEFHFQKFLFRHIPFCVN